MTINLADNNPRISYSVAQGATQQTFAVPFEFFNDSDLSVYVDGVLKAEGTHYTITGGDGSTGNVVFVTATPPAVQQVLGATGGSTVVITRTTPIERTSDFSAGADINRAALNEQLDILTAMVADAKDRLDRSVSLNGYDAGVTLTLPVNRAGKVIAFDANGNLINGPTVSSVDTVSNASADIQLIADNIDEILDADDQAAAAAASASAAATSASAASGSATAAAASASTASASADAALAALDSFDDRYLGQKASDPTLDNDGNALTAGALYFNTTDDAMKVYEGSIWVAAYASLSGALIAANNLSDLASASAALTNLGLTATSTELNYVDGVTSSIQTQLNTKAPTASPTFTGQVSIPDGTAAAPALTNTGDTDTGLYFPAANQMAVSLGGIQKAIMNADETTFKTRFVVDSAANQLALVGNNYANGYASLSMSADGVFDITPLNSSFGSGSLNLSGSLQVSGSVGTSGQLLTSGGSGAAPSWQDAPASGIQTFTASGSITAGNVVGVNSNGTVSSVGLTTSTQEKSYYLAATQRNVATSHQANIITRDNSSYDATGIVPLSNTTFVSAHIVGTTCVARIVTLASDGSATFGADFTALATVYAVDNIVKVSSDSFALLYRTSSTANSIIIGQVSGSTITFGSPLAYQSGLTYNPNALANNSGSILLVGNVGGTNTPLRAYAIGVSGTTATSGGAVTLRSAAPSAQNVSIAYDSVNNVFVANANMVSTPWTNLSFPISISGTTISGGSQYNVFGSQALNYDRCRIIYDAVGGRFIAINPYQNGTSKAWIYSATVSSLVITASPQNDTIPYGPANWFFPTADGTLLLVANSNVYSVSYDSANGYKPVFTALPYAQSVILANNTFTAIGTGGLYARISDSLNSTNYYDEKVTTMSFSTIHKFMGSANQSVSNGQSVKVAVSGGIATNLSGLTAGARYSITPMGTIVPSTSAIALTIYGIGLSATSLLLNPTLV